MSGVIEMGTMVEGTDGKKEHQEKCKGVNGLSVTWVCEDMEWVAMAKKVF